MKNILVSQLHSVGSVARGVMLEILQDLIDENPDANIYYLSCSNTFNVCHVNTDKLPEVCYLCKQGIKKGLRLVNGKFTHLEINDIVTEEDILVGKDFSKQHPVINKDVSYKNYQVGEAAVSSYISKTRDKNLLNIKGSFASELVENDVIFYSALDRFFKEKSFLTVYNFNGRNSYQKAILTVARKHNVDCYNKELARPGGYLQTYKNVLPHHIKTREGKIEEVWNNSKLSTSEKLEEGGSFFSKKIQGVHLNDKVYIKDQEKNKLPGHIDYSKKTFVLFTSSDDEFAAVGKEFENPFFEDQNDGIRFVANLFATKFPDYNLIIRMHPNLKGIEYDYARDLKGMDEIGGNITVIEPESPVDSYALLKVAEKVIVFGSSIGIEANYWDKPVILLAKCFYYYADIAYVPGERGEIEQLISSDLEPKDKINAIKFGYYYLNAGEKAKYYYNDNEKTVTYKGQKLFNYSPEEKFKSRLIKVAHRSLGARLFVK